MSVNIATLWLEDLLDPFGNSHGCQGHGSSTTVKTGER